MIFEFSSFSFDTESGDLKQNGLRVPINQQTAKLLAILLLRAGKLVTREEIQAALWPDHEISNYDQVINSCISRLRYIFRDDPQNPKYIERLPKRGYRLIVDVSVLKTPEVVASTAKDFTAPSTISDSPKSYPRSRPYSYLWVTAACALVLIGAIAVWWYFAQRQQSLSSITLGIASFEVSGTAAEELSESFRLDLADSLAQLPQLNLRAIHSTEHLHLGDDGLQREAAKLGLDAILFGHFLIEGNECHLLVELVNAHDGTHISSFQYQGTREELTSMRDKIQQQIFNELKLTSSGHYAIHGSTKNAYAYEAYLQGQHHLSQQTEKSLQQAVDAYNVAITKDPSFARAYTGLARAYLMMTAHYMLPQSEGFGMASNAADKARQIDPSSAEIHGVLGLLSYYRDWNLQIAESEEREAIHLDPNQAVYHQWLAALLCVDGQCKEALHEVHLAHACDPEWPPVYITEMAVAHGLGDNAGMVEIGRRFTDLLPDSSLAHDELANALWYDNRNKEAIAEWQTVALIDHDSDRAEIETRGLAAFRREGIPGYARVRLDAIRTGKGTSQHPNDFAAEEWYVDAGEPDEAIIQLRQLFTKHDPLFIDRVTDPIFAGLRANPAFRTLIAESGVTFNAIARN